jgi:hypothetical protein
VADENSELFGEINQDLEERNAWEARQRLWLKMRGQGAGRANRPWPGAANVHVPVADTIISKIKPYYVIWVLGPELLASFYSLHSQGDSYTDAAAKWFDYKVRECSNFTEQFICGVDSCLQNGHGVIKPYWDLNAERLAFQSINPYYIIVPPWSPANYQACDRVVHVMQYSEAEYKRDADSKGFNADQTYIDEIKGTGKPDDKYEQVRYVAEGLQFSRLKDLIILWEVYLKQTDGTILVKTFSPQQPDEPAREDFKLPYEHKQIPLIYMPYEITDGNYFSSRGVMELTQMFEASACKSWNEKLDFMSIANRPVLSTQGGSINAQNIRWEPGAVYDSVLQLVQQPTPPVSFDEEIANTRSMAEQRVGIPDFGIAQPNQPGQGNKTATETNVITNVMQQSNDLRARILKGAITQVFEQAWELLKQFDRKSLNYFWRRQRLTLDQRAFSNKYVIRPNGSVDGYSREREIQKLMQLRQMSQGAPWIQTSNIDKKIIELMDSDWITEFYTEPPQAQADQAERQAIENTLLVDGFVPQVKPDDDHVIHLQTADGFMESRGPQTSSQPLGPQQIGPFMQHMQQHIAAAHQDAQYWKQHGQEILPFEQKVKQTMAAMQAQAAAAQKAQMTMQNLRGGTGGPLAGGPPGMPPGGGVVPGGSGAPPGAATPPNIPQAPNLPQPGQQTTGVPMPGPNGANGGLPA